MKVHTTNYQNAFIAIADDCPAIQGEIPVDKGDQRSVASIQYELLKNNPYKYTSDDVLFQVFAERKDLTPAECPEAREDFYTKGQPCFRASPLTKTYGWGVHSDAEGRIAIYGCETEAYARFMNDVKVQVFKAMKTKR